MESLAQKIRALRGDRNFVEFAEFTGVNRQTLKDAEEGVSIRVSTLRRIAEACKLDEIAWAELLAAWAVGELGEDARLLDIQPPRRPSRTLPELEGVDLGALVTRLFFRLSPGHQADILKALTRPGTMECLAEINRLWESKLSEPKGESQDVKVALAAAMKLQNYAVHHPHSVRAMSKRLAESRSQKPITS